MYPAAWGEVPHLRQEINRELPRIERIRPAYPGSQAPVARARSVAGYAIPGIVVFFFWLVVVILVIILLAFIVHWAGGGQLNLRLGHFVLGVGFT